MNDIIKTVLQFVIGLALLPTAGGFVAYVSADPNLSGILGFTLLMSAGLVILALGIIYSSVKGLID